MTELEADLAEASRDDAPTLENELSLRGERVRRSHVHSACEVVVFDQEADRTRVVVMVHPGHVLASVARLAAEPTTDKAEQNVEDSPAIGTHDHRRPHGDLTRARGRGSREFLFPRTSDVDA
jgi:hypothetical protein